MRDLIKVLVGWMDGWRRGDEYERDLREELGFRRWYSVKGKGNRVPA